MNQDDVEALKAMTGGSKEIIEALKKNSATYEQRTKFSQEKWLKKKLAKYQMVFEVKRPTAAALCEMYHLMAHHKICELRPDSLGFLL